MNPAASWRLFRGVGAALFLLAVPAPGHSEPQAPAQAAPAAQHDATLYRVYLRDGGVLVSYGDFARISDSVVLSVPVGGSDQSPTLHLVTISETDIDWDRTNAYAQAARARRYADTRGEQDFARLTRDVADLLYKAGLTDEPAGRLALAESARKLLVEWPQAHYDYRADELSQMTSWLDQVVSELRVAAGVSRFDLTLVARGAPSTPDVQLLPAPDLGERAASALAAARRARSPAERVTLLRAVIESLQPAASAGSWLAVLHEQASAELATELKVDRAYADLSTRVLGRAAGLAARANVRGLEALVRTVLDEDARLNRARPVEVAALLAALDAKLDAARRLRLARDAWELRRGVLVRYWSDIRSGLDRLLGLRLWLTDVRQLAGPSPSALRRVAYEAEWAGRELSRIAPPAEAAAVHSTLASSSGMAVRAARTRLDALRSGSMETAWEAASAAAGALMLLDSAIEEYRRIIRPPSGAP